MFASIRSSSRPLELKVRHPEGTGTFSRNDVKTLDLLDSRNESSRCVLRAGILVFAAFPIWSWWWSITVWLETTDLNVAQIFWRVVFLGVEVMTVLSMALQMAVKQQTHVPVRADSGSSNHAQHFILTLVFIIISHILLLWFTPQSPSTGEFLWINSKSRFDSQLFVLLKLCCQIIYGLQAITDTTALNKESHLEQMSRSQPVARHTCGSSFKCCREKLDNKKEKLPFKPNFTVGTLFSAS